MINNLSKVLLLFFLIVINSYSDELKSPVDFHSIEFVNTLNDDETKAIDLASKGDLEAQVFVAKMLLKEQQTDKNYVLAAMIYQHILNHESVKNGSEEVWFLETCYHLGQMLENGLGVEQDYNTAAYLYKVSASFGDHRSLKRLTRFYAEGKGVAQDVEMARLLSRSRLAMLELEAIEIRKKISNHPGNPKNKHNK